MWLPPNKYVNWLRHPITIYQKKVKSINGNFTANLRYFYVSLSNLLIYGSGITYKVIVLS